MDMKHILSGILVLGILFATLLGCDFGGQRYVIDSDVSKVSSKSEEAPKEIDWYKVKRVKYNHEGSNTYIIEELPGKQCWFTYGSVFSKSPKGNWYKLPADHAFAITIRGSIFVKCEDSGTRLAE